MEHDSLSELEATGFEVELSGNDLEVADGGTASVQLRLSHNPGTEVTVQVAHFSGNRDIAVTDGAELSFSSDNWDAWQDVTFVARSEHAGGLTGATFRVTTDVHPVVRELFVQQPSAASTQSPAANAAQNEQPNIVLIFADDIGYEVVSPLNEDKNTPILDRLSDEGMRFDNAFSNAVCTPSRVKIMTGLSNVRNFKHFGVLEEHQIAFGHQLKKVGYATAMVGKWQLGGGPDAPQHFGFDQSLLWQQTRPRTREGSEHDTRYPNPRFERNGVDRDFEELDFNDGEYGPDVLNDFVRDFMEAQVASDTPFLVYYAMNLPHSPFDATPLSESWDPASPGSTLYLGPGNAETRNEHFKDMVAYIDTMVGRVEDKLIELGVRDNTLILFIGDNGSERLIRSVWEGRTIPGGKRQLDDNGLRVPFIANWPAVIAPNSASDRLVDLADILPTFCEMAGAPLPGGRTIDGFSLLPEFRGADSPNRDFVYIYYLNKQVLARTADYMVRRNTNTSGGTLYHFPERFTMDEVPEGEVTPEQRALKAAMVDLLDSMIQERGSAFGPPL